MSSRRSMTAPRRSRRAAPGSDDEDGEAPSQDVEVVEDAEPRERKSLKKGKPSSKRAPSRRAGSDDDDEDDIPEIDVNNFHDQPLQKDAAVKLNGALSDWQMAESKLVSVDRNPYNVVISAAEAVTEYGDEQAGPILEQLDEVMRELIDAHVQMDLQRNVLQGLRQRIHSGEEIDNSIEVWEKGVKTLNSEYLRKTSRKKYGKDDRYQKFKESIWNIQHERDGKAMPPLSTFIEKEDGDEDDSDDDVEVGGATQDMRDPLTMTVIADPVTSSTCKHSFSKASMQEYLRAGQKKCPHLGCNQMLAMKDLHPDPELEKKIKAFQRREQRREADESDREDVDDDDVIE